MGGRLDNHDHFEEPDEEGRSDAIEKFHEYLKKIQDVSEDKCWFCNKTPDQIRKEFLENKTAEPEKYEDLDIEDLIIMTYKLSKPVCAGCYFAIKNNPNLIKEILKKPQDDVWG